MRTNSHLAIAASLGACVLFCTIPAVAEVRYVSLGGLHLPPFTNMVAAATNIQDAIDAATNNDSILVMGGTYYVTQQVSITKPLYVYSGEGASNTVVDGNATTRCFWISETNAVLEGFTIRNGESSSAISFPGLGGGLIVNKGTVRRCVVAANAGTGDAVLMCGGGVYVLEGGRLDECTVVSNAAMYGGGVYCAPGGIVSRCMIGENTARSAIIELPDNQFVGVIGSGGGVYCESGATVSASTIWSNTSSGFGGGAYCAGGGKILGCVVGRNAAGAGGGIQLVRDGMIINSTVINNEALYGGLSRKCGGGVYMDEGGFMCNSIVWGNAALEGSNWCINTTGDVRFTCTVPLPPGSGNITNDPQLVAQESGDCHLSALSPCIDAGTNDLPGSIGKDIDGQPRVFNARVDIGADEATIIGVGIEVSPNKVRTVWDVVTGARCQLQWQDSLLTQDWNSVDAVTATNSRVTVDQTNAVDATRFYQLRWLRD